MTISDAPPFFTVIVATYNVEATIIRCLDSVYSQVERPQVILADGLSADNTMQVIEPYRKKGLEVICERDLGVYDAWNKGLALARGQWIIFMGADDYYADQNALQKLRLRLLSAPSSTTVAYGAIESVDVTGKLLARENVPWEQCRSRLNINMPFTHVGCAHRADLFKSRRFDISYRIAGDYNFLYPEIVKNPPLFVDEYLIKMTYGGLSTSIKGRISLLREIIRIRAERGILVPLSSRVWTRGKLIFYRAIRILD